MFQRNIYWYNSHFKLLNVNIPAYLTSATFKFFLKLQLIYNFPFLMMLHNLLKYSVLNNFESLCVWWGRRSCFIIGKWFNPFPKTLNWPSKSNHILWLFLMPKGRRFLPAPPRSFFQLSIRVKNRESFWLTWEGASRNNYLTFFSSGIPKLLGISGIRRWRSLCDGVFNV